MLPHPFRRRPPTPRPLPSAPPPESVCFSLPFSPLPPSHSLRTLLWSEQEPWTVHSSALT
uniref:Uncharacterized protein n=1 Tax=Oryza glumipatula TaxID=40148 RepID=A0A0E0AKY9_9ORYZ